MTAIIRSYLAFTYEVGATFDSIGQIGESFGAISSPGTGHLPRQRVTLASLEKKVLWSWEQLRDFELLAVWIRGSGYVNLCFDVDTPVSGSDLSPSGNDYRQRHFDLSCYAPFILNTDQCLVNTVIADENTLTGGYPTMFGDAQTVNGKVYKLYAYNPGAENVEVVTSVWN